MAAGRISRVRGKPQKVIVVPSKEQARKRKQRISRPLLSNKTVVKLRYTEIIAINPGAGGSVGTHVYSANGMFDPNITGIGHQPRGFDQLMSLYDHYTVIQSGITAMYTLDPSARHVQCILALRDRSAVYSAPSDYTEMRNVKTTVVSPEGEAKKLTLGFSPKSFLGVSKPLSEKDLTGTVSANPQEQAFFHVGIADMSGADLANQYLTIQIDYVAVLTEPVNPSAS